MNYQIETDGQTENDIELSDESVLSNVSWSDDSIFQDTISGYKKLGCELEELCEELYNKLLPTWAEESQKTYKPDYSLDELIAHLKPEWDSEN